MSRLNKGLLFNLYTEKNDGPYSLFQKHGFCRVPGEFRVNFLPSCPWQQFLGQAAVPDVRLEISKCASHINQIYLSS